MISAELMQIDCRALFFSSAPPTPPFSGATMLHFPFTIVTHFPDSRPHSIIWEMEAHQQLFSVAILCDEASTSTKRVYVVSNGLQELIRNG